MEAVYDIDRLLIHAVQQGVSDIHLRVGEPPIYRFNGKIIKTDLAPLSKKDFSEIIDKLLPPVLQSNSQSEYDIDFSYEIKDISRFRINLSRQLGKTAIVIRVISYKIQSLEDLNLPASINKLTQFNNGIVFITGQTGSGKTTTIASILEKINQNEPKHIITIEDPIEFIYEGKKSLISQRQIGIDTPSYNEGLKHALRQDPDIIFIGEIRDRETLTTALKAAETGHLVFATLHTNNAVQTINRIYSFFEPQERDEVKIQLANLLRATLTQKLIVKRGQLGRIPACEMIIVNSSIKYAIEHDQLDDIYKLGEKGSFGDIITLNKSLKKLVDDNIITKEAAITASDNRQELQQIFRGVYTSYTDESDDIQGIL